MFCAHSKFAQALVAFCGAVSVFAAPVCLAQGAAPTQTVLSIAPNPSVNAGTRVTLSAYVTSNGSPFHNGIVFFCKADAAHCEDSALLGSAPIQAGGWAKVRLRIGVGTYSIRAVFQGMLNGGTPRLASTSDAQTLTIKGKAGTITTSITPALANGVYTLTSRVASFGRPSISGNLSFADSLDGGGPVSLGSTVLSPKNTVIGLLANASTQIAHNVVDYATGDFNRDGIPDVVTVNSLDNSLSILLGKGDGTFNSPTQISVDTRPDKVAVADFNADGIDDLAVTYRLAGNVAILLGKADGTFAAATHVNAAPDVQDLVVGDFNGDGKLDIVTGAVQSSTVSTLLGNGDGTFAALLNLNIGDNIFGLRSGDFNGDNVPDVAVATTHGIWVLLGTGNGSFSVGPSLNAGNVSKMAVADFNGDGITDLAAISSQSSTPALSVYIANGDGSFTLKSTPVPSSTTVQPSALVVADFNGDGVQDIAVDLFPPDPNTSNVKILLGAGDGTFPKSTTPVLATLPASALVADFNGDSIPDLITERSNNQTSSTSVAVLAGIQITTGAIHNVALSASGSHSITATFSGSDLLDSSVSPSVTINIP